MSDEGNNQLNKQSKFRFLNPDEKKKLKELNEEILGENKNITFDSNVDLTVQFEKKGYDTQRYNIKKLVNERLDTTQVFDVSRVLDREKSLNNNSDSNNSNSSESESHVVEHNAPNMIVTEIYRNDIQEINEKQEINQKQEVNQKTSKPVNETSIEANSSESEIDNTVKEILKNTTELTRKDNKVEDTGKDSTGLEESKRVSNIDDNKINTDENLKGDVEETKANTEISNSNTERPKTYPYNSGTKKKIELPEDKRVQAKELFLDEDVEDEPVRDYTEFKNKATRVGFYLVVALILIIIILLTKGLVEKLSTGSDETTDNTTNITNETTDNTDSTGDVSNEDTTSLVEAEPPIDKDVMSNYNAVVEILSSNTSNVVLEITNDNFQYVEASNDTDFFNDYVYANIKNAQPEKKEDRLVILFGKDDNKHFGSLRYLDDLDFFNSILVDYTKNNITTRYKALSYYKTPTLDSRFYSEMSDSDIAKFISEEVNKSLHVIRKDITIETDSKILTLVTFDSNENVYHCLHLINIE